MRGVVLVHGFTQTATSWSGVLDGVALEIHPREDLWATAEELVEQAQARWVQAAKHRRVEDRLPTALVPAPWVGYSMGGRLALHVALGHPHAVSGLVLLGATAGIEDDDERAARRSSDRLLARAVEEDGAPAFLERWLAQPLFEGLTEPGPRQRNARVLAACLRRLGTGSQDPLWDRLEEITVPTLVLAGERDEKFIAIGQRLSDGIGPNATFATVPKAGHAAHLENRAGFRDLVEPFLLDLVTTDDHWLH
jgi:2-succinyl-6-hydroxy-2,4-cyclohexadiene-1-carboxylate synthase